MTVSDDDLRRAYTELAMPHDRTPTLDELLSLVHGTGDERDRLATLVRAMATPDGRRELNLLRALHDGAAAEAPAAATDASDPRTVVTVESGTRAKLGSASTRHWQRWLPQSMLAAALLFVSFIAVQRMRTRDESTVVRSAGAVVQLASPVDGARASGPLTFVWHQIPGATYELELYTATGMSLAQRATSDTTLTIAADAIPSGDTRWWITARLDDGTQVRSATRRFEMK